MKLNLFSLFGFYRQSIINQTIERCAEICDGNARDEEEAYQMLKALIPENSSLGLLRHVAAAGQAVRDAKDIRALKRRIVR